MKKILMLAAVASFSTVAVFGDTIIECATGSSTTFDDGSTLTLTSVNPCTIGATTFSNFTFYGATGLPVSGTTNDFSATIYADTTTDTLEIDYTGLTSTEDVHLTFQGSPGVTYTELETGVGSTVSEGICNAAFTISSGTSPCGEDLLNTSVLSASNGGTSSSSVTYASTDYFYKDITGGSEVDQVFTPEPITTSLVGLGLLGLGIAGRKQLRRK